MIRHARRAVLLLCLGLGGCVRIPAGIEPVTGFEADRYLGTWHEIARLDHGFERGLEQVTATYTRRADGTIGVLNRGRDGETGEWREATGRARFVEDPETGYLKVSFFGPFYGAYVIFELDAAYEHALVSGPNRSFLWLLARDPDPERAVVDALVERAAAAGFETEALIFVPQGEGA